MKTIRLRSWRRFEETLNQLKHDFGIYRQDLEDGKTFQREVGTLFRGQADHSWNLKTTLERRTIIEHDVKTYLDIAVRMVSELESYTDKQWNIPPWPALENEIKERSEAFSVHLPAYDYLVYLRHHGYPSPLLDWTASPHIALYFAYLHAEKADVAVYCYIERPNLIKGGVGGEPMITLKGPYVSTHRRHFAQKAWYTLATHWDYSKETHIFCPHERVFDKGDISQDALIKIVLPQKDRLQVLRHLDNYNINHFTLFQSEDALIKALESRHFDKIDAFQEKRTK